MHIPDGYLSPATCGFFWAAMLPIWLFSSSKVKKRLQARQVPLLAIGAVFSFVVMLFNLPIPGGSTGHATGAVLLAILLGPYAACIAISVTLVIQALLFADGGVLALGANCFNLAFAFVFSGYYIYRAISLRAGIGSKRMFIASGLAGYLGILLVSLLAALELGIQPLLHHTPSGQPLYSPFGFKVTIPVMLGEHLLVFGWIEALVTIAVIKYLQKANPTLLTAGIEKIDEHKK